MASWRSWLGKRALLVLPLLGLTYGVAWAVQGSAPFLASSACPEPSPSAASPAPGPSDPSDPSAAPVTTGDGRLSLSFGFQPDPVLAGAPASWTFTVTNVSDAAVALTFNSGQDGDVVLSQNGEERYRWSAGRFFTQSVRTIELGPSEAHHFALDDSLAVEPGVYDLVASVASDPAPVPAARSVTVEPSSGGGSVTPTPSDDPSASPTPTDPTSPSAEPTASATPTPDESPSPSPLFPFAAPLLSGRSHERRRRRLTALLLAGALLAVPFGEVQAQEDGSPDSGSGGKNVVLVMNETDGRLAARANLVQGIASGPTAIPENLASASASCTDCRTVSVAMQAVLIVSDPDVASPRNAAVAANSGCLRCETFAYAWQYVVSTGGPVRITPEGHRTIADLEAEASELAASDLPFPQLVDALDEVAGEFRAVIDQEVERVGGKGVGERALDVEADGC